MKDNKSIRMFGRHEQRPAPSQVATQTRDDKKEPNKNFKLTVQHVGRLEDYTRVYYCNKYECDGRSGVVKLFDDVQGKSTVILSQYNYVIINVEIL